MREKKNLCQKRPPPSWGGAAEVVRGKKNIGKEKRVVEKALNIVSILTAGAKKGNIPLGRGGGWTALRRFRGKFWEKEKRKVRGIPPSWKEFLGRIKT